MDLTIGLAIPFLGTTLGAAMVFFMKNKLSIKVEKLLLGFASGVMIAASVWSLIIPSIDMAKEQGKIEWLPAAIGFILGILFLLLLDSLIPHLHLNDDKPEGIKAKLKKTTMMVFAVTLHNIPEGMAVGVTFAGAIIGNTGITMAGAFALAIGIAIQNFPEGAIIYAKTGSTVENYANDNSLEMVTLPEDFKDKELERLLIPAFIAANLEFTYENMQKIVSIRIDDQIEGNVFEYDYVYVKVNTAFDIMGIDHVLKQGNVMNLEDLKFFIKLESLFLNSTIIDTSIDYTVLKSMPALIKVVVNNEPLTQ